MNTQPNKVISISMLIVACLLVGFSMGHHLAPLAAWIGPVFFMRFARDHKAGRGFFFVFIAYIPAFLIGFGADWFHQFPLPIPIILAIVYGFLWTLPYLADRLVGKRFNSFVSTLIYPLTATTIEFINTQTNPVGTWGATGFTQYGDLALMQFASVAGVIGITFLMGWFASVANWAWENKAQGKSMLKGLITFGSVLAVVYIYGYLRLNLTATRPTGETVRVAGITSITLTDNPDFNAIWEKYFKETVREAQAGAKVISWHEGVGYGTASDVAQLVNHAQDIARQNQIYLVLPLNILYPDSEQLNENKLLVIDPAGTIVIDHIKYGGTSLWGTRTGDKKLQTVDTPFGVLSAVICWDMDFPTVIQQTGQKGVGLIFVPSGDWEEIDPIHSQMAVFRAIENGMSVFRQVYGGLSIAVDPYGRVLAQTDFFGSTDRTMVSQVPVGHVATIYTMFGRWFGWVCAAGFLFMICYAVVRASIERKGEKSDPLE